jgi:peptide/nickel transport system permease protein
VKAIVRLVKTPISFAGLAMVLFFVSVAVAAPFLAPPRAGYEAYEIPRDGFSAFPKPPNEKYPFGTTQGQYDIFYGVVWGTRSAFLVGFAVTGSIALIGVVVGTLSGYFGGVLDDLLMRITDVFLAFPFLIAAMTLTAVLGRGLDKVMIAMIAYGWMSYARVVRAEVLSVKQMAYVEAARAVGIGHVRMILRYVLPNSIYVVLVMASMDIGSMVLWASTLSFLGLGAPMGHADWGQLISMARNWIVGPPGDPFAHWYTVVYPSAAILLFVLAWNLIGDTLRDILDPRMKGEGRF